VSCEEVLINIPTAQVPSVVMRICHQKSKGHDQKVKVLFRNPPETLSLTVLVDLDYS